MQPFTSFLLAVKNSPAAMATADNMVTWLVAQGFTVRRVQAGHSWGVEPLLPDAVLTLGGDGTLVGVARRLLTLGITAPLLGVNFGRVGFLAETSAQDWQSMLAHLVQGALPTTARTALSYTIIRNHTTVAQGFAVNDITVSRGALARVLALTIEVEKRNMGVLRADGLIISTPSGTSGYAASAGGALVHPSLPAISLTAISPFLCRFPPLVLPEKAHTTLGIDPYAHEAVLTIDGQDGVQLQPGDVVHVVGVPNAFRMFVSDASTYYNRLIRCGFIHNMKNEPLP